MRWIAGALLLAGCAVDTPTSVCDAQRWDALVGQPEEAIYGALPNVRVIRPGDAVTKDFNPERLNAVIDARGRITRFGCY